MGTALCRPLVDTGWNVAMWGTEYDNAVLDAYAQGQTHPAIHVPLAPQVKTYRAKQLDAAVKGAEVLAICVAAVGLPDITKRLAPYFSRVRAVWVLTKGFVKDQAGHVHLLAEAMEQIAGENGAELPTLVSIGGPVIARQCALSEPTATVYACQDLSAAVHYARAVRTDYYRAFPTEDTTGVELLAPLKNSYAIALGVTEGIQEATGSPQSNLRAAVFAQAIREMSRICEALGGRQESAIGLAGVGDLEVTGISGRNKFFGMRLGRGEHPVEAEAQMKAAGHTVEGVHSTALAVQLIEQRCPQLLDELPLLRAVNAAITGDVDIRKILVSAALPAYPADIFTIQPQSGWNSDWTPVSPRTSWGLKKLLHRWKQ